MFNSYTNVSLKNIHYWEVKIWLILQIGDMFPKEKLNTLRYISCSWTILNFVLSHHVKRHDSQKLFMYFHYFFFFCGMFWYCCLKEYAFYESPGFHLSAIVHIQDIWNSSNTVLCPPACIVPNNAIKKALGTVSINFLP